MGVGAKVRGRFPDCSARCWVCPARLLVSGANAFDPDKCHVHMQLESEIHQLLVTSAVKYIIDGRECIT